MSSVKFNDVAFEVDVVGENTGKKWFGKFRTLKSLSYNKQLIRDRLVRELLGGLSEYASPRAKDISEMFADFGVSLTEAPDWWTAASGGRDLEDDNLIKAVYEGVVKAQTKAVEKVIETAQADTEVIKRVLATEDKGQ